MMLTERVIFSTTVDEDASLMVECRMKTLFQSRLRNLGFGFLAAAIMLTCVWQASVCGWIYVARSCGEWQYYFLAYGDDFTVWRFKPAASAERVNDLNTKLWPERGLKVWMPVFFRVHIKQAAGVMEL